MSVGFHDWLLDQSDRIDMVGALARHARRDALPRTDEIAVLLAHLRRVEAKGYLLDAARLAHTEWRRSTGRRAGPPRGEIDRHGNIVSEAGL